AGLDIQPAILLELPEVEHIVADRNADARRETVRGKHAIGQILDRKIRCRIDRHEGAERGIVGGGQSLLQLTSSWRGFPRPSTTSSLLSPDVDARDEPGHDGSTCPI